MAITINGSGTITGVSAGGLPDNCITADDLATTLDLSGNTITLPSGTGGKVLQVVQGLSTSSISNATTSFVEAVSVAITPSSTSSKILVTSTVHADNLSGGRGLWGTLFRDSTNLFDENSPSNPVQAFHYNSGTRQQAEFTVQRLDSPTTTSEITYSFQFRVNAVAGTGVNVNNCDGEMVITAMEIAG